MTAFLLDTHVLLWTASGSPKLSDRARALIADRGNDLVFSVASVWEVAIKTSRNRADFTVDVTRFRSLLLGAGFRELPIRGYHALAVLELPALHADPFDRMLLAQAGSEGLQLLTNDKQVLEYGDPAVMA